MVKYSSRILNASMAKVFLGWVKFVRTSKRHRMILGLCRTRWLNKLVVGAMRGWRAFAQKVGERSACVCVCVCVCV